MLLEALLKSTPVGSTFVPPTGQNSMTHNDPVNNDMMGYAIAMSSDGTTILAGAYNKNTAAGAAYIFTVQGGVWKQQAKLVASNPASSDYFGAFVSISGDGNLAVVTSYNKTSGKGYVYVFSRNGTTWSQQQTFTGNDSVAGDNFGFSVAISSDGLTMAIGAIRKFTSIGVVYVFIRSGTVWTQQARVDPFYSDTGLLFGYSVSISGDGNTLAIGAIGYSASTGDVYIYTRAAGGWNFQTRLMASDRAANEWFGNDVSISDDGLTVVSGAHLKGTNIGAAYVFVYSGGQWVEQAKLVADDALTTTCQFGYSTDISNDGNVIVIGSPTRNSSRGQGYIFVRNGTNWVQQAKVLPADVMANDKFSYSVAISGDGLQTAYSSPGSTTSRGKVYVQA